MSCSKLVACRARKRIRAYSPTRSNSPSPLPLNPTFRSSASRHLASPIATRNLYHHHYRILTTEPQAESRFTASRAHLGFSAPSSAVSRLPFRRTLATSALARQAQHVHLNESSKPTGDPRERACSLHSAYATAPLTSLCAFHSQAPLNEAQVPLISSNLRSQLFPPPSSPFCPPRPSPQAIEISLKHLTENGLLSSKSSTKPLEPAIDFTLPPLKGSTLSHHFHSLGATVAEPYLSLAKTFSTIPIPSLPAKGSWAFQPGWARYSPQSDHGLWESVDYPDPKDRVTVFDVETLPFQGGSYPIMAVAMGETNWYAWCSPWLTGDDPSPNHLIPFGPSQELESTSSSGNKSFLKSGSKLFEKEGTEPRLIIGHNVLFDRARISSEYESLRRPSARYIDTLSLHVAVSGLTNPQRPQWMAWKAMRDKKETASKENVEILDSEEEELASLFEVKQSGRKTLKTTTTKKKKEIEKTWKEVASMNSLFEVARLHCGIHMDKSQRDILIDPSTTIEDVRASFDDLIDYCARDVLTTAKVYQTLLPKFLKTCPHPVSFAGVLLMSQPVLPVDYQWPRYLERAESTYVERLTRVKDALKILAEEARAKMDSVDEETGGFVWQRDVWLRQLDWSLKKARRLPGQIPSKRRPDTVEDEEGSEDSAIIKDGARPNWFAQMAGTKEEPEPKINLQSSLAAALLRTTWKTYPVVFSHSHGYLFVVSKDDEMFKPDSSKELLIDPSELHHKDYRLNELKDVALYTVPGIGKGRCLKILGRGALKRAQDGLLGCDLDSTGFAELLRASENDVEAKLAALARIATTVEADERAQSVWLNQLDWDLVPLKKAKPGRASTTSTTTEDSASGSLLQAFNWPKWYWELDLPGLGLDVSVRKRAVPLLLRLRWRGYPIVHSRQHGWIYRVPFIEADDLQHSDTSLKQLKFTNLDDCNLAEDSEAVFFKLPHPDGEDKNVGSPLSKSFLQAFEDKILTSDFEVAQDALALNASCSYWASSRERITNQFVVWGSKAKVEAPTPAVISQDPLRESLQGLILPQVIPMGTITRRAVERTWLTASNAKKNRVGSELKSMIRAPPGFAIVGADVDSEELWICSVMGDAQFGLHGATAIGWMTLKGTKSAGTDLHSKTASILGISRDDAKVFNYSRIYGAGVKHAVQLLLKANPTLSTEKATELAKNLYAQTKGLVDRTPAFRRQFWHGGTESFVFNKLEGIAQSDRPRTPALGCGLTDALTKAYLPADGKSKKGAGFMPSRINWVVQSSGVDYLHLLLVAMEYLTKRYEIDARYMISVHDEVRYLVKEEDKYRAALAMQVANLWTRSLFAYRLQIPDLPQGCAFFSAVDIDQCFRKEVNMTCRTPSNPDSIPFGESLDIAACLLLTNGGSLYPDGRPMTTEQEIRLPSVESVRELSEDEWRGELHRVDQIKFLEAQTVKTKEAIAGLWKETIARNYPVRPVKSSGYKVVKGASVHFTQKEAIQAKMEEDHGEEEVDDDYVDLPEEIEGEFSMYSPAIRSRV